MKQMTEYKFPQELKYMSDRELDMLSVQIRDFLMDKVSRTGGHLASNLGVVELTIALHRVFDSPKDRILWDVGHQSYVHKILTGRAGEFDRLRKLGGMSGFPKREESPHDVYDAGHSSDSISVALGIAKGRDLKQEDFNVITVIGDGALTGGIAYEALNNAAASKGKMIIIINDNQMSISPNVGGVARHLSRLRVSYAYTEMKKKIRAGLKGKGSFGEGLYRSLEKARDAVKYTVFDRSMFENLGFKFYGPIDGHDISELTDFLEAAKRSDESVILHVVTKKGKGIRTVEENSGKYHGVGPFDPVTMKSSKEKSVTYSDVFGSRITEMAERDSRITAVSAAMIDGTGLTEMQERFPDRVFDVGIAEQHAVSFSSGLALQGLRPFTAVYSTFLQRAYDEIILNICMQKLPVVFCIDRAGNVGEDGETHNGQFDLSYLCHMPNMTVMAPSDNKELEAMMEYALKLSSPCAIRYPRGKVHERNRELREIDGKCEIVKKGGRVVIIAAGKCLWQALKAEEILSGRGIECGVVNAVFVKPLDEEGLLKAAEGAELVVTLEDNVITGGFGSMVNRIFAEKSSHPPVINIGWPDAFVKNGKTEELEKIYGLDGESVADRIMKEL
ncbi:MAG: 1-deoxy-D-xylulose-5-phosphate synthase [Bacillota bacterium]|nr:1-deoxy-D-xylulose-5-phosphate synthase [Bacillota bacterium]